VSSFTLLAIILLKQSYSLSFKLGFVYSFHRDYSTMYNDAYARWRTEYKAPQESCNFGWHH